MIDEITRSSSPDLIRAVECCADMLFEDTTRTATAYARRHGRIPAGVLTLIDPDGEAIRALHVKHGGQIRTDIPHASGDVVVWYPFGEDARDTDTRELLRFLDACGQMVATFTDISS